MTTTAKPKTKFSSRNLNTVYKAPVTKTVENAGGYHTSNRMLVLKSSSTRGSVLVASAHMVAAPAPINTPSLRKENKGQDVHVNLVPTGRVGWGHSHNESDHHIHTSSNDAGQDEQQSSTESSDATHSSTEKQSPYESPSEKNVWEGGGISRRFSGSGSHNQRDHISPRTSSSSRSYSSSGSRFGSGAFSGASSGRWGDDAVEQDIARSDMMRAMQKEREFPQLKDAVPASDVHGAPYPHHHPYPSDQQQQRRNSYSRDGSFSEHTGYDRPRRYDYDVDRRSGGGFPDDRYASRVYPTSHGYDRSHQPSSSFSYYRNNNHSSYSGDYNCNYQPSDARYDGYMRSEYSPPPHHHHPQSGDGYYGGHHRGYQHDGPEQSNHFDSDFGRNRGGWRHHFDHRGYNSAVDYRNGSSPTDLDLDRSSMHESANPPMFPSHSPRAAKPSQEEAEIRSPSTEQSPRDALKWKATSPAVGADSVWRKTAAPVASGSVHALPGSKMPATDPDASKKVESTGKPVSVDSRTPMPAPSAPSSASHAAVTSQVRILKRDGPKLLFDPKTGTMVSAEEKVSTLRNQRAHSTSLTSGESAEQSGPSRNPAARIAAKSKDRSDPSDVATIHKADVVQENASRTKCERTAHAGEEDLLGDARKVDDEKESDEAQPRRSRGRSNTPESYTTSPQREQARRDLRSQKKVFVKSNTKKYVLAYRPVVKPAKDAASAEAASSEPAPMKRFNELFSSSKPVKKSEESVETFPAPLKSRFVKRTERPERKLLKKAQHEEREKQTPSVGAQKRTLSKDGRRVRRRAGSRGEDSTVVAASDGSGGCSNAEAEATAPTMLSHHDDALRVRHNKVKTGLDVDVLKHLPEGSGVVVLKDAQEGIAFLPEDSCNKFETVKSRRTVLLERKQQKEAAAVQTLAPPKRTGIKKQFTSSGIVMTATSRTSKRTTLVVGMRASRKTVEPSAPTKSTDKLQLATTSAKVHNSPLVLSRDDASPKVEPATKPPNRAVPVAACIRKPSHAQLNTRQSETNGTKMALKKDKSSIKPAVKDHSSASRFTKHERNGIDRGDVVSAIPSSSSSLRNISSDKQEKEKKKRAVSEKATEDRQQARRMSKRPSPSPEKETREVVESVRPPNADSNLSASTQKNRNEAAQSGARQSDARARKISQVGEAKPVTDRSRKSSRSKSSTTVPVKVRYVVKHVGVVDAIEVNRSEPQRPASDTTSSITKSEGRKELNRPVGEKDHGAPPTQGTRKSRFSKDKSPLPASSSPPCVEIEKKNKSQLDSIRGTPPTDPAQETTTTPTVNKVRSRNSQVDEPRQPSTSGKPKNAADLQPNAALDQRTAEPAKKRFSKSKGGYQGPPAVTKTYKQVYVVKKASSTASPTPSSSAA